MMYSQTKHATRKIPKNIQIPIRFMVIFKFGVFPGIYLTSKVVSSSLVSLEDTLPLFGSPCQQSLLIHNTACLCHIPIEHLHDLQSFSQPTKCNLSLSVIEILKRRDYISMQQLKLIFYISFHHVHKIIRETKKISDAILNNLTTDLYNNFTCQV